MFKRISRSILSGNRGDASPGLPDSSESDSASERRAASLSSPHTILVDKYTGTQADDLGRPYVPESLGGISQTVVDSNASTDTPHVLSDVAPLGRLGALRLAGGKEHWRDLFDYDREQEDGGDTYGSVEGLLESNLTSDEYYNRVRKRCVHVDASATRARRAAEVIESCLSYTTVSRKLRATRLWAVLLRYCSSESLVAKTSTPPFLRPVQRICLDINGHAGLRARMYQVVAGAVLVYPDCKAFNVLRRAVMRAQKIPQRQGIAFSNPLFVLPNVDSAVAMAGEDLHQSHKLVRLPSSAAATDKLPALAETVQDGPRRFSVGTVSTVASAAGRTLPPYKEASTEDASIDALAPPDYE